MFKLFDADLNMFNLWKILAGFLGKTSASEGSVDAGLRANLFGFGKNDETLFWEAVALAETKNLMKKPRGRKNLDLILLGLDYWQKKHFFQMIGKDTQSITIEVRKEGDPESSTLRGRRRAEEHEKGKAGVEKTTMQGNLRGAMLVAFFAEMPSTDALAILKNSGTLTGITDDIKEVYGRVLRQLNEEKFAPLKRAFVQNLQGLGAADPDKEKAYKKYQTTYTKYSERNWMYARWIFAALLVAVLIWT